MGSRGWNWLRRKEQLQEDGSWSEVNNPDAELNAPMNRRQRRLYVRFVQESEHPTPAQVKQRRYVRRHIVGFGKWRTPRVYLERSYQPHDVFVQLAPRAQRRAAERAARKLVRP